MISGLLHAQSWQKSEKVDTFSSQPYVEYTLTGKFLTPPRETGIDAPVIVMDCMPGEKRYAGKWYFRGANLNIHISTGAVVDSKADGVGVWFRRDEGKSQFAVWSNSKDGTALFPTGPYLNQIIYGHDLVHKEGTTPPVKKLVLMVDEYLAARIVMEFDLPDSQEVYDACGLTIHQK